MPADLPVSLKPEWQTAPAGPTAYPGPLVQSRDITFAYSENLPSLLAERHCSLLVSTYLTGNLVVLAAEQGKLVPSFHTFERPMGLAVKPGWLAVGTRTQVWYLRSAPDIAAKLAPPGRYDSCWLTRASHYTGNVQCHELAWIDEEPWLVNTLFSCLSTCHPAYSFAPRWRPPFVSALAPEDRCHLNGLAVADGKVRYVTALGETDTPQGWRPAKASGGCLLDVASGQTVVRGLAMPHSPRVLDGKVFVLESGRGRLVTVEPGSGQLATVVELPGYTRGLAVQGGLAFVGLSKVRTTSALQGVPIAAHPERLKCGVVALDLAAGRPVAHFEFTSGIDELFDVQVLPGSSFPYLSGPLADRAGSPSLWTVPPRAGAGF